MAKKAPKSAAGRPKDAGKRVAIIAAAQAQFLTSGFERASMDAIAAKAGVSKLTVYGHFKDKDTLFREVITAKINASNITSDAAPLLKLPVKDALLKIANNFTRMVFLPETIHMYRLMLAEAAHKPKVSRIFYETGPERVIAAFTSYLTSLNKTKRLKVADPARAAAYFFTLLKGDLHQRALLNLGRPTPKVLAGHVRDVVDVFMKAYSAKK